MKKHELSDEQLLLACESHVQQYRGVSESTRLLEELLTRHTKLRNIARDLMK